MATESGEYYVDLPCNCDFIEAVTTNYEDYQKTILKIWMLEDKSLHYYIEKFFWSVEKLLDKISLLESEKNALIEEKEFLPPCSVCCSILLRSKMFTLCMPPWGAKIRQ